MMSPDRKPRRAAGAPVPRPIAGMFGLRAAGRCREPGCRAAIMFARIPGGGWMPVNPDPDPAGNLAVRLAGRGLEARVLRKGEEPRSTEHRAMPHFATCAARKTERKTAPAPEEGTT